MIGDVVPVADIRPGTVMDLTLGRRPNRTVARPLDKLQLPRPLRPSRRDQPRQRRAHPDLESRSRSTRRRCASRAGSAPASTARPAPPACRPARSRPISARSTPRSRSRPGSIPTTASTSSSSIAAPPPARSRPASFSMPASSAPSGRDLQLMQWTARRPQPMVRGLGRRPAERRLPAARAGPGHLQLRPAHAPDPRLCAHAPRPRFPRRLRHADPRGRRRHASPAPAGRAAMAARSGSTTPAASPPPIRT